jgi:hypothetical protein
MRMTTISAVALALAGWIAMTSASTHAITYQVRVPSYATTPRTTASSDANSLFNGDSAPMSLRMARYSSSFFPVVGGTLGYDIYVALNSRLSGGRLHVTGIPVIPRVEMKLLYDRNRSARHFIYGDAEIGLWTQFDLASDATSPHGVSVSLIAKFSPSCREFNPQSVTIFMDALHSGTDMTVDGIFEPGLARTIVPSARNDRQSPTDIRAVEVRFCVTAVHPE